MPSDADLMKIAISDLNNVSAALEDRHRALQELLELVEPIENANGTCLTVLLYTMMFTYVYYGDCFLVFLLFILFFYLSYIDFRGRLLRHGRRRRR